MLTETGRLEGAPLVAAPAADASDGVGKVLVALVAAAPRVWLLGVVALSAKASGGVAGTMTGLNRSLRAAAVNGRQQKMT
jgi:hypothetical protein